MKFKKYKIILTCEHGGADVPRQYKKYFLNDQEILKTHRALDIGALAVAQDLKSQLKVSLDYCTVSRLIVDTNRFLNSTTLFSEFVSSLSVREKNEIIKKYYTPHWKKVSSRVLKRSKAFDALTVHIAVHSMTDSLNGKSRPMQMALLYDPASKLEKKLVRFWIDELKIDFPDFLIARNKPYRGDGEGLTSYFRNLIDANNYIGIELEINQKTLVSLKRKERKNFSHRIGASLKRALLKIN